MRNRLGAMLAALSLVLSVSASAQPTTGTLAGRLVDARGLAVPNATVIVTGPQGSKAFVSDVAGRFNAPFLTPGIYDVRAELQGFKAVALREITVSLARTTVVNIRMDVGVLTETVEVTGSTVVVDTSSNAVGATLSSEHWTRVPVGRRVSEALYLAAGVSASAAGRANPSVAGGSALDNHYVIDGVNITHQGYGALGTYSIVHGSLGNGMPLDFIDEIQITSGGHQAEFGQATGGIVNLVLESGANALRGSVFGYIQPNALSPQWKTYDSVEGTVNTVGQHQADLGVVLSGPVYRNRLFFFGAINPGWETQTFVAPDGFPAARLGEVDRKRRTLSYAAKGTHQLMRQHRIDASVFGDPSRAAMGPQRASALLAELTDDGRQLKRASELASFGGHNQTIRYHGIMSAQWLLETSWARATNTLQEAPLVDEWLVQDKTVTPTRVMGGLGLFEAGNDSRNSQLAIKSTTIVNNHQVRYGVGFEDAMFSQVTGRTGPPFVAPDGRTTATGATIDILPDATVPGGRFYRVTRGRFNTGRVTEQTYWNFFVQDQWNPTDRFTVNAGLRYEQETLRGPNRELHTLDGDTLDALALKGNWAPRVGFAFDALGNGRSRLFASWGRFFARLPNDIAARALSADDVISRADYYDAALSRPIPDGIQVGGVIRHYALSGAEPALIDPDVKLGYKDEFGAGFEWEAFPNTSVGIRYVHRNIGRAFEDLAATPVVAYDLALPGADTTAYIVTNPSAAVPTTFPELGARFEKPIHTYDAVELTVDRRFSENWFLFGSYRWSRLFGTYEGPAVTSLNDFPTEDPSFSTIGASRFHYRGDIRYLGELGKGPLPLDRPHQFKVSSSYATEQGFGLGAHLTTTSGKPLTPLAALSWYTDGGEIPEGSRGSGIATIDGFKKRTPFEFQLDLQASYHVRLGDRRLTLLADAFNLFNLQRTIDYDAWTELSFGTANPDFGTPTSQTTAGQMFQPPFRLRLGMRFEW